MTVDQLIDRVTAKVKDASGEITPDDYEAAAVEALKCYSRHRPRHLVEDLPGTGANDLALPADWAEGTSTVVSVEYPVGRIPESLIDARDYRLYRAPAGLKLRLLTVAPAAPETVRLLYTTQHTEASIPVGDEEAVANLAAAVCLRQLAARYGQTSDPTIGADVVNYRSKADEFRRLAQAYDEAANAHLGIGTKTDTAAASVTAPKPDSKRVRLTHWRR
jgi:hypothetical protein